MPKKTDKIDFVTQVEETSTENLFEEFYEQNLVPLVEEENYLKSLYRSRFWGCFWSVCFLLGANFLIVLFRRLMSNYPINYTQILLVVLAGLAVMAWPIVSYYKASKHDLFDVFLKFYGDWKHCKNKEVTPVHEAIVPEHDTVLSEHGAIGEYDGAQIEICEMKYQKTVQIKSRQFHLNVSRGVMVYAKFGNNIKNKVLLFDKKGFRRKGKYEDMLNVTDKIYVPAANYFHIFSDDVNFAKDMLPSIFFERILDMKDSFKASSIYVEIQDDLARIYLEGASLYFDDYNIWSRHADKEKFAVLNQEMEQTLMAVQLIQVLRETE